MVLVVVIGGDGDLVIVERELGGGDEIRDGDVKEMMVVAWGGRSGGCDGEI